MPDPILRSTRVFYDVQVLWVCIECGISQMEFVQPRCVQCLCLMVQAKK